MKIDFDVPNEDELKFILDSWSSSYRKSKFAGTVPNNMWQEVHRSTMTQLMSRENCRITVALTPSPDPDIRGRVMGYSVSEPGILHWLYVKKDYRRLGIGSSLLTELLRLWPNDVKLWPRYTHRTDAAPRFLPPGWKWDTIPARVKG